MTKRGESYEEKVSLKCAFQYSTLSIFGVDPWNLHFQHASPAGFNQKVGDHNLLNTTKPFVFLTLVDITSYEPTEYVENTMQGRHKPTDLDEFSFSVKKAIKMDGVIS